MNFINQLYKKFLERPKLILITLILIFSFSVYNAKNFQLDASADSLLLENDPDLNYLRSVNERYSSEDFFVITYSPKKRINEESLKELKNVVSLISPVIQINRLRKGETAGYNQSYRAKKDIVTATIPLGYADGVKIRISNIGYVFYKNVKLPMIARISMDLMIVDVTKVKKIIKIGDYLEVFGKNLNLDSFAKVSDTSPYDIITSVSERCERVYIN